MRRAIRRRTLACAILFSFAQKADRCQDFNYIGLISPSICRSISTRCSTTSLSIGLLSKTIQVTIYNISRNCPHIEPLTMASSSRPSYPDARPVPRQLDSTASSLQSQSSSSSSSSPRSPLSPYSPASPTYSSSGSGQGSYFTREPMSLNQTILQRTRPRSPSPNKSPLPSPTSAPKYEHMRSVSDPSAQPASPTRPGHLKRKSRNSGTVMQCGRHGNEWLFGNISVTDTVKGLFHKDERRN